MKTFMLVILALVLGSPIRAETVESFALIVTNNRSAKMERPDLQYADDDGVRYLSLFGGVTEPGNARLLTRLDRATSLLHPELAPVLSPPRRDDLLAAVADMRKRVDMAKSKGARTRFYFVFAGHGDMEGGAGYLDLEDGRMDAAFLEKEIVEGIAADEQHILLDSCNSFFVVNPRKPGGKRWATPKDMAMGFASRHPNVGLFLSTNSEAEVYEWSEIESGIFSHEVRSGLSGAADVDGDGVVSYAELAGFVERANARLPRANVRPQIFARGPAGNAANALFAVGLSRGRRLTLGAGQQRVWIRGGSGERLLDLHKEAGPMTVVVPGNAGQAFSLVERKAAIPPEVREYYVPAGEEAVALANLSAEPASSAARGGSAIFGELFALPFGPSAFVTFQTENTRAADPIFGISPAEEARMRHYLTNIAKTDQEIRHNAAMIFGATGLLFSSVAIGKAFSTPRWEGSRTGTLAMGGLGLGFLSSGLYMGLTPSLGQKALDTFDTELRLNPGNPALAIARTESGLDNLARRERTYQRFNIALFGAVGAIAAVGTTVDLAMGHGSWDHPSRTIAGYGIATALGVAAWSFSKMELPTSRLLRMYRDDPDLKLRIGPVPVQGGMGMGVGGQF